MAALLQRRLQRFARFLDVRPGEGKLVLHAFAILLFLVAGHTVLETARDTLLLSKMNPRVLGVVYLAVAAVALPAGVGAAKLNARVGAKRALMITLLVSVAAVVALYFSPTTDAVAILLYVTSALIGSVLISQYWSLLTSVLTVAQGRRLMSPVASAGVVGGVLGSAVAAIMVSSLRTRPLLLVAAASFVACVALASLLAPDSDGPVAEPPVSPRAQAGRMAELRGNPYVARVAWLAVLSTAAVLSIDYLFKWSVATSIPKEHLGTFLARYYAAVNVLSLIVQVFVGAALVRRIGVTASLMVTPMLLLGGGIVSLAFGGALTAVLLVKGVDGGLRHSIHRTTTELLYMPVPAPIRARVKPLIDGPFVRLAQAVVALIFLAIGEMNLASWRTLGGAVVILCAAWALLAGTMRRSYLRMFREALAVGPADVQVPFGNLDIGTAELLMEHIASTDAAHVIGAMNLLARSGHVRLIPALVLLHDDERVVVSALKLLDSSNRTDWFRLAERLLTDNREPIRLAAMRALARHRQTEKFATLSDDLTDRARGYALFYVVLRAAESTELNPISDDRVVKLLSEEGKAGHRARHGFFAALADAPPSEPATQLLHAMAEYAKRDISHEFTELLAQAATDHEAQFMVPTLVERLELRAGRDALRAALVRLGDPALTALWETLQDSTRRRRLRLHIPRTLSRFGNERAAEMLLKSIETEKDGLVRYKAIRGLGRLTTDHDVRIDRKRVERLCKKNLVESLRVLALWVPLHREAGCGSDVAATGRLLDGLLDDKLKQSLERAFRLLKILYVREDIHRVHWAAQSTDKRARANAGEFLDALLAGTENQELRLLFRLVTDDFSPQERVSRAAAWMGTPNNGCESPDVTEKLFAPPTADEALGMLVRENDVMLAALAVAHATALGGGAYAQTSARPEASRANVRGQTLRLFSPPKITPVPSG